MREPDPEVIRMFLTGQKHQIPGVPNDVPPLGPTVPDHWIEKPAEFRSASDTGYDGHRRDKLDDDEPAARRDDWLP